MAVIVSKQIVVPVTGRMASDYAVGETVKLKENGTPVEYIVVHQGLPGSMYDVSCDGTWVLRKSALQDPAYEMGAAGKDSVLYPGNIVDYALSKVFITWFSEKTVAHIQNAKIPYYSGIEVATTGAEGTPVTAFVLSVAELNGAADGNSYLLDGNPLDYFRNATSAAERRKRRLSVPTVGGRWYCTRTPNRGVVSETNNSTYQIDSDGGIQADLGFDALRPTLILRSDTLFDSNNIPKE